MTFLRVLQVTLMATCSTIIVTLLQVVLVNFRCFVLHCQHNSFLDPSCNFHSFVHDISQGPSSKSHSSVQHYHCDSSPSRSCNTFCGFVLHCQHDSFSDPSCNLHGFMHDFSPGLSCSCHGFMLHCQHGSSLYLLDNLPSFCQPSFDRLLLGMRRFCRNNF